MANADEVIAKIAARRYSHNNYVDRRQTALEFQALVVCQYLSFRCRVLIVTHQAKKLMAYECEIACDGLGQLALQNSNVGGSRIVYLSRYHGGIVARRSVDGSK